MIDYIKAINTQLLSSFNDDSLPNNDREIRNLIAQIRDSLLPVDQQIGVWEMVELNFADKAIDAGFNRLALIAARQALSVAQLSPEAYAFGLHQMHSQMKAGEDASRSAAIREREDQAKELLGDQQMTAENLALDDQENNYDQKLASDLTAIELRRAQISKAAALLESNRLAAIDLADANEGELRVFAANEKERSSQEETLVHLLSAASGAYSSEATTINTGISNPYSLMRFEKDRAAHDLKVHQQQVAEELEDSQLLVAADLKVSKARDADRLYNTQKQAAVNLVERQAIQAIRKRNHGLAELNK